MTRFQKMTQLLLAMTVMVAFLAPVASAQTKPFVPKGGGFNDVVKHLEKNYGAKKTKIPMLGLAKFAIWMIRPAGVKGFKLAVFEDQNFVSRPETLSFNQVMRQAFAKDWSPLVQINSKRDGNSRTFIYVRQNKKDVEFALASLEENEAVVLQAKFNPDAAAKFLENPKIMGISLGGSVRGNGNNTATNRSASSNSTTTSIDSIKTDDASKRIVIKNSDTTDSNSVAQATTHSVLSATTSNENNLPASADHNGTAAKSAEIAELKTPPRDDTVRIETRLVNLNVKALNKAGQPVTNLKQEDFAVYEDGVKQEVAHFKPVNAPVNLILLLDLSGSTQKKRKAMIEAANRFIDGLPTGDRISVVAFTRQYKPLTDFTSDKTALKEAVKKINKISGGTAFYDATWKALDQLDKLAEARKAIVVLTDGEDESLIADRETTHNFDDLLGRASEEDVTIYPIYFSPNNQLNKVGILFGGNGGGMLSGESKGKTARKQLEELAAQTGGEIFSAQREDDLESAYKMVANELHTLYSLAYSPDKLKHDGQFRKIAVKLGRDGAVAKTRRGYFDK